MNDIKDYEEQMSKLIYGLYGRLDTTVNDWTPVWDIFWYCITNFKFSETWLREFWDILPSQVVNNFQDLDINFKREKNL